MIRSAQVRFSTPTVESVGAQKPGISRVYELIVGETIASSSGISFCWPPTKCRMVSLIECGWPASWNTGLPSPCLSDR